MANEHSFEIDIKLLGEYQFEVNFGEFGKMMTDEPAPLGQGHGPNPARLLAAAVANCLCASLLFAIRKYKGEPNAVSAKVKGALTRVEGRLRIANLKVDILLNNKDIELPHLDRALSQFEDFCIVTQSVRSGIEVDTRVLDNEGNLLYQHT